MVPPSWIGVAVSRSRRRRAGGLAVPPGDDAARHVPRSVLVGHVAILPRSRRVRRAGAPSSRRRRRGRGVFAPSPPPVSRIGWGRADAVEPAATARCRAPGIPAAPRRNRHACNQGRDDGRARGGRHPHQGRGVGRPVGPPLRPAGRGRPAAAAGRACPATTATARTGATSSTARSRSGTPTAPRRPTAPATSTTGPAVTPAGPRRASCSSSSAPPTRSRRCSPTSAPSWPVGLRATGERVEAAGAGAWSRSGGATRSSEIRDAIARHDWPAAYDAARGRVVRRPRRRGRAAGPARRGGLVARPPRRVHRCARACVPALTTTLGEHRRAGQCAVWLYEHHAFSARGADRRRLAASGPPARSTATRSATAYGALLLREAEVAHGRGELDARAGPAAVDRLAGGCGPPTSRPRRSRPRAGSSSTRASSPRGWGASTRRCSSRSRDASGRTRRGRCTAA